MVISGADPADADPADAEPRAAPAAAPAPKASAAVEALGSMLALLSESSASLQSSGVPQF